MTVVDATVLWCVLGQECDGTEVCRPICHPTPVAFVPEFVD